MKIAFIHVAFYFTQMPGNEIVNPVLSVRVAKYAVGLSLVVLGWIAEFFLVPIQPLYYWDRLFDVLANSYQPTGLQSTIPDEPEQQTKKTKTN